MKTSWFVVAIMPVLVALLIEELMSPVGSTGFGWISRTGFLVTAAAMLLGAFVSWRIEQRAVSGFRRELDEI